VWYNRKTGGYVPPAPMVAVCLQSTDTVKYYIGGGAQVPKFEFKVLKFVFFGILIRIVAFFYENPILLWSPRLISPLHLQIFQKIL